jgi:hypothetical protein
MRQAGLVLLLAASVAACSAMIPVRISGSLEQPTATFGVDPAKPEKACVSGLAVHEMSNAMMRPVWAVSAVGPKCRKLRQVIYGQTLAGFDTDVPAAALKPGVRYAVVGYGLTGGLSRVPWRGGGDFVFEDGRWLPAPPFAPAPLSPAANSAIKALKPAGRP